MDSTFEVALSEYKDDVSAIKHLLNFECSENFELIAQTIHAIQSGEELMKLTYQLYFSELDVPEDEEVTTVLYELSKHHKMPPEVAEGFSEAQREVTLHMYDSDAQLERRAQSVPRWYRVFQELLMNIEGLSQDRKSNVS